MRSCHSVRLKVIRSIGVTTAMVIPLAGLCGALSPTKASEPASGDEVSCPEIYRRIDQARPMQLESMRYLRCSTSGEWSMTTVPLQRGGGAATDGVEDVAGPQQPTPQGNFGCQSVNVTTHTDANFDGGQFIVQAGFEEQEIAAVSYTLPAGSFPIQIHSIEGIFAQQAAIQQTTTHWSVIVWEGFPDTGTIVVTYTSDDKILPHLVMPQGTHGTNILVTVDPTDPEQIIINNNGTNTFSVGYRIDQHTVPGNPCFSPPPANRNAFPTTDVSGLASPQGNWIDAIEGTFCCPAGWHTFASFPVGCRPSGDWVIRASYCAVSGTQVGACCTSNGMCIDSVDDLSCSNLPGIFQGGGTLCSGVSCSDLLGACCDEDGICQDGFNFSGCSAIGGDFEGAATTCGMTMCDPPTGACCAGAGCLNDIPLANCPTPPFTYGGNGAVCEEGACVNGACCFPDGSCQFVIEHQCDLAGGAFSPGGNCMPNACPQPEGACCVNAEFCFPAQTEAECDSVNTIGFEAVWQGMDTVCIPNPCTADMTPPEVTSAFSLHEQGTAGSYAIDVLAGDSECRLDGPTTLVISFDENVAPADGVLQDNNDVALSSGTVTGQAIGANVLAITIENVDDAECLTIDLSGITDFDSNPCELTLALPVVYGDANGDGAVGAADVAAISAGSSPEAISSDAEARNDINRDGLVGVGDVTSSSAATAPGQTICP